MIYKYNQVTKLTFTKNMKKKIAHITICLLISLVCEAQTFIKSTSDTTVVTEYNDGKLWAYRDMGDFVVGLCNCETKDNYGKYYQINIFIYNHGENAVTFIPDNVKARMSTKIGDTLQMTVYTNETFQKKIKRSQAWAMALYGFANGINAGMAGHSTSYSTSYSPNGYAYTTITHHYDANATYQANMATSYQMMTLGKMMENENKIKEQGYLKKTTIHPGESIVGYMNIKLKKGLVLTVDIPIGKDIYSFDWDVSKKVKEE